jgi:hypothetical protein
MTNLYNSVEIAATSGRVWTVLAKLDVESS